MDCENLRLRFPTPDADEIVKTSQRERLVYNEELNRLKKELKGSPTYTTKFWLCRQDIAQIELRLTRLTIKPSQARFDDKIRDFWSTDEGQRLLVQEGALKLETKQLGKCAQQPSPSNKVSSLRQALLPKLGMKNPNRKRESKLQAAFRADLIEKMGSRKGDRDSLWCPVVKEYIFSNFCVTEHFFPSTGGGEVSIESIFGSTKDAEGKSELFKAENGIVWSKLAQSRFSQGLFIIVPDINDNSDEDEVLTWQVKEPKEYKIKILNRGAAPMQELVGANRQYRWCDMDNERLEFKTSFRPRAKYLYFAYCEAMLRLSYIRKRLEVFEHGSTEKF